ncbi:beta strand repeat-containing protein [Pedobacter hiemivivus]|uniref:Fibronectin type-III domain-containing protein n=1 Tax=Pedobacter hiemivivus TaxID=2530454 RepID=A0A4R0NA17_9SPHI|nr:hypothetical protein [Pedobacter hiemivivus]TCC96935.1 hypothetical protein EZ444_08695 [Pedobacter hiemivivus]
MKKNILSRGITSCLAVIFLSFQLSAQSVTNYTFTGTTATFTALSGASATSWTGSTDDGLSTLIPIGFDFWYMGARYTSISASTNGWISMGSVPTDYVYTNSLSTAGSPRPVIAPLWDDLDVVVTSNVTYKTTGAVGNRVFTLQYLNVKWYYLSSGAVCSFKVNLYETSGKVEFVYRSDATAVASPSGSIGITATATGSGNFLSVNNAGTSVSSTTEASVTTKRVTGRTYTFTAPIPIAPSTLSFSAIGNTAMTLNWADLSSNERGFAIYRSTDGINYTFISQTAAAATSSIQSGLTSGTTYYWKVYAITEGGMSTALSGSQTLSCTGPAISQLPSSSLIAYYKLEGNANDVTGNNPGTFQGGTPAQSADRFDIAGKAYTFNGTSNYISTANVYVNPGPLSTSTWFKTTTTIGGALIGFSSLQTGGNGSRDRFIYMTSAGTLYLAVAPGAVKKYLSTTASYNDGNWHMATSTLGTGGLKLYVDGVLVASDATVTTAETTTGYWRLGYSDLSTWPNEPSSYYFQGTLDDAVIYHKELSSTEVGILYNSPDGAGSNSPVCAGTTLNLTATTVAGATYSWTGPNGFTSSLQNPGLTFSAAYAGIYTVQATVAGCAVASVAYVSVTSTGNTGQWTGNLSTDWATAGNWCDGVVPGSSTDVIIAANATRMPNISTSVSTKNLTINTGASVTLTGTGTLNVAGTLTNNGTFTNTGTVNFNGTGAQQTFSGIASFFNLTLNNSNGLLLPAAITVNNNLLLTAGTLNANNFNLTIKGNWTNNVSTTAFTAGTATVTFNNTTAQVIAGTFSTTFNNLVIANTASTVTLNTNISISGNLSVNSGAFDLSTFTANRATAGGTLMVANNATLKIGGTNTYPVNFTANTLVVASTVEYSGTAQTVANQLYGNLTLSSSGGAAVKTFPATALTVLGNLNSNLAAGTSVSFTAAAIITVNGNVSIGASTTFNGSSFSHSIGGNWVNNGTFNGNTGSLTFTGPGRTVSGAGTQNFNNLTIAASLISFSAGSISLTGNLATTGSGSFSQLSGGTVLMTGTSKTISGTGISPDNLTISGTVSTTEALVITGNLSVSGSFTTSTGATTMSGTSKTISGAGTMSFGILSVAGTITSTANFTISSSLSVNGSLSATAGTATFTGTATLSGTANLFNTTINGTSLQLSASSTLGIASALTITSGILDVSSSAPNTVNFNSSAAQNINAITYNNLSLSNGNNKTAIGALTINNSLTIGTSTTFIPGAFTHSIYSNWNNSGTFTAGTSTIQFLGNQPSNITGATTFNILTVNNTTATTGVILQSNITAATVNMTLGTLLSGSNTLTITGTRTGNGIILGNIQRNHVFTTGVAYAFEGPNNLVTFSGPSGINSVTVSVVVGPLGDFPFGGSISRFYTITVSSGTYTSATLRLHYEDTELNGSNESTMGLWHYNGTSWMASGKTANDATANYVEQTLVPDITNRWTLSDNSNVVQWNGSVSTNWNTAANWTTVQGSASTPPSATDIVNLGTITFSNQPTISSTVNVKNINFGSAQAVTLSMASGGSLTSGDIYGTWSSNVTHTINAGNQSLIVNGNLSLSDGTSGHAINLNIGTGTVTLGGSLTQSGGANVVFSGTGNLIISVNHNYVNGTFTPGTGTVTYSGITNQVIGAVSYNNLTINKSAAAAEINNTLSIGGNLTVTAGELDNFSATTIIGNVSISSGATLHNNSILYIGGNWANSGTYNDAGTKTVFNGGGTQTITASTFNNLEINKPVGTIAVLTGDVTLKGNLTGTSGTLDIKSFFFNRTVVGGTAIIADAGTLIIAADNAPNKFANYALGPLSTVIFNGTGTQHLLLPGVVYGNLTFRDTGLKILYTPITVNGDLTIETGATFDGGSNTLTVNGNWINSGTYIPSASTVLFAGATKNITGNNTFHKATVTGSYTIVNDATFNTLLNITSTGALYGGSTLHITMNGDLINSGILYNLGSTTFTGNVVQTLSLINAVNTVALTVNFNGTVSPVLNSTSAPQFGFLNINNTGGVNPSVGWTILYALTVGSGVSFTGGNPTHNLLGALTNNGTITSSGTLNFIPTTAATINMGSIFSSTGTVVFGGAGATTLAGSPTSFRNVVISNTNTAGITPSSAWTITNNLTINSGAILNAGSYAHLIAGNISNNGTLNRNTSTFTMNGAAVQNIYSISPFNNLTVSKTAGSVQLLSDVGVNGTLNFTAGNIQTGSNVLTQSSTGNITGAAQNTGWINGRLQKNIATGPTTKTFEIGDTISYTPVSLTFASVTTAGDLIASTTSGDHPEISGSTINASKSVNRFWTLENSGIAFTTYNVTFNFVAADLDAGVATSAFIVGGFSGFSAFARGSWTYPMVGTPASTTIQATGLTEFAEFQIGEMSIFIKTWDGGAGTSNWGDAANWNVDGVPTATDNVELTGANTININVVAVTKNLLLSNTGLILTTNAGNALTVSGDFSLNSGTFNTAAAFPSVSGTVDVSNGTVGFIGGTAQTIPAYNYYNLTSSSTGSRTLAGTGTIGIANTFSPGTNTYTITGSTVNFNGSEPQTIPAFNYNQLTLSNAGLKTFNTGTTGIAGTLAVTGSATTNTAANASTISYNGPTDQTVTTIPYYNLDAANSGGIVSLLDATINNNLSITSGTVSIGTNTTVQKITVDGGITIASGATLNVATISDATHLLTISGDVTNNGTLNLRPDANSSGNTTFNKNGVQTITGAGTTTSFNSITTDMGTLNTNYLEVTAANFSAPDGFLTLRNGSFQLNSSTVSLSPFTADIATDNFLIPATAGLWVNAGIIISPDMNWTVAGLVKVTGGALNMGSTANNYVLPKSTAHFVIAGGNFNLASAISNPSEAWTLDVQGGTMTINTLGSTTAGIAPFNMDGPGATFGMSGGTIVIQNAGGSAGQNLGYRNLSTTGTGFIGGTLQMGNASTAAAQTMDINSTNPIYNLSLASSNVTVPLMSSDLIVKNNVTITAGTLDINSQTLKIGGSISNNGSFIVSDGTIEMNGSAAQNIAGAAFTGNRIRNLTINNTAGVTLGGSLDLTDILLVSTGQFNSAGYLKLASTTTKTALIDGSGIGSVTGSVTMQRYLAAGFGYKYFSAPFQNATVNSFAATVDLNASFPNFYNYIEDKVSSGFTSYTNPSNPLVPLQGYAADFGSSTSSKTVNMAGTVSNGALSTTLYNHNQLYTKGFNLVGNPYPSPINWDASSGWTRTNIDNAVYFFNSGSVSQYTGGYSTYVNGISSDGIAAPVIASMQGFFVHVSDGTYPVTSTLAMNNSVRVNDLAPVFHKSIMSTARNVNSSPRMLLRFSANFSDHAQSSDPIVVYTNGQATQGFDKQLEAVKLMNDNGELPNLYTIAESTSKLVINALSELDTSTVIPLGIKIEKDGNITFNLRNLENWPANLNLYLTDAVTGANQDLQRNPIYTVSLKKGTIENRFSLRCTAKNGANETDGDIYTIYGSGGTMYVKIRLLTAQRGQLIISNIMGQVISRRQIEGNGEYPLTGLAPDVVYVVSFITPRGTHSKKILISSR